jgi:hypothetical protein
MILTKEKFADVAPENCPKTGWHNPLTGQILAGFLFFTCCICCIILILYMTKKCPVYDSGDY